MSALRNIPLLRVAVCLAAGIGLADVLCCHSLSLSLNVYLLLAVLFLLLAKGIEIAVHKPNSFFLQTKRDFLLRMPTLVSVLLLLSVGALGAWRYQSVHDNVVTQWPAEAVDCRAIVRSAPVARNRSVRYTLDVSGYRLYGYVFGTEATAAWGDTLLLKGVVIRPPQNFSDSLTFDYARVLYCRRISGTVMIPASKATLHPFQPYERALSLWDKTMSMRIQAATWLRDFYTQAKLPDDVLGVVEALSLGDRSRMSDDVREAYTDAGASHLLALSGLHVGVLYMLLTLTLGLIFRSRVGKRLCGLLAVVLLWAFALLTGFSPSLVRAVVMFTIYAIVSFLSGDRSPLSALSLTALIMLGVQPFNLFSVGFQLSFVSMLTILLLMPYVEKWRCRIPLLSRSRLLTAIFGVASISIAAQMGVAPLVLYHFGYFSTYFLVTNLVVQPFVYAVMLLMILWIVLSWTPLAPALSWALTHAVRLMNALLATVAHWPGSVLRVHDFTVLDVVLLWMLFFFLLRYLIKKHTPSAVWALACVAALLLSSVF